MKPTIGRKVWFFPSASFALDRPDFRIINSQVPHDADIVYVHTDRMVNLAVKDHKGQAWQVPSVPLHHGDEDPAQHAVTHCEWMPYQAGQAKAIVPQTTGAPASGGSDLFKYQLAVARLCHEINRAYCEALGDTSQPKWDAAPDWQKKSALSGVRLHFDENHSASASHESWMREKLEDGWTYGPVKDPELKQHHCLVPFEQLPVEQQAKDFIFRGVVHAMRHGLRA